MTTDSLCYSQSEASLPKRDKLQILKTLQPEQVFGQTKPASEKDPTMSQLLAWGYEDTTKHDYTKNGSKKIQNKIRKMKREYISEAHDNYRKPERAADTSQLLFDYFDQEELDLFRKKVYTLLKEKESEHKLQTCYQQFFASEQMQRLKSEIARWTPAGTKQKQNIRSQQDFLREEMEGTLERAGFKR